MDDEWISTAEVASQLAVTPLTVYGFIDRGEPQAYPIGTEPQPLPGFDAFSSLRVAAASYPNTLEGRALSLILPTVNAS